MNYEMPMPQPMPAPSSGVRRSFVALIAAVLFFTGLFGGYMLYPSIQGPPPVETWISIPGVVDTTNVANNTNLTITANVSLGFTLKYAFENCRDKRNYTFKIELKVKVNFSITLDITINESRPDASRALLSCTASQLAGKSVRFRFVAARWTGEVGAG